MGVYLRELERLKKGREEVRSHLKSIKDFHRNPLMHPEQTLESVDQALDLLSAIRCSIGYMLQEIPADHGAPLLEQLIEDATNAGLEIHQS
jgi:succinylglutamate desuccinylase